MAKGMERRALKAQETKRRLMEKAVELISRDGYGKVSVSRICEECGVSKGTYYIYYKSKEEIIHRMAADFNEELYQKLNEELVYDGSLRAGELYRRYVRIYADLVVQYGKMYSKSYQEAMLRTGMTGEISRSDLPEEHIFRIIDLGIRNGEFRSDVNREAFWEMLVVMELGVNYGWSIDCEISDEAQREKACRLLGNLESFLAVRDAQSV